MSSTYSVERVLPYGGGERKSVQMERMFDAIAGRYDRLNRTLSLGLDKRWRRKGIDFLRPFAPARILDMATGTGDLAIALYRTLHPESVTGADVSEKMMDIGRRKAKAAGYDRHISFEAQDCLSLAYPDCSFDAVTVAFGVRNFEHIEKGVSEMFRTLKSGGQVMILELSTPATFPAKMLYRLYLRMIPCIGGLLSNDPPAYRYLPASVRAVPQGEAMTDLLRRQGFTEVQARTLTFGVCSLYTGTKELERR
ncbi:MAG: demethylmenaquinone methyltransferase [Bacteroidales bacterium]